MNDRAAGAFEAVSYMREFLRENENRQDLSRVMDRELSGLIDDISSGVAVDFRERLGNMRG
jgi:hypothetical protein